MVYIAQLCAALDPGRAANRVNVYRAHKGQVNHDPTIAHSVTGDAMTATAYRDQ